MEYFSSARFMPHGHCYLWEPALVGTMVVTDALIGLAYISISVSLYALVRKIQLPFSAMFIAFGLFIFACGATHFMEIYNLWVPNYWLSAFIKVVTASASVATACLMFPIRPKIEALALAARLSEERRLGLETAKNQLEARIEERTRDLQQAVEARDEFISIASHELRTPLTPLKMQIQISLRTLRRAKDNPLDVADLLESLDISLRQVDRLTTLVENLLDVSRIQSGTFISELEDVNLSDLVRETVIRFSGVLSSSGCAVTTDLDSNAVGHWDRLRIEQVLVNLISNALKYGGAKPFEISVKRSGDSVRLVVKDNGIGIPVDLQQKIFERYERAISHISISGLGLGLYIVKQIVEAHRGSVEVESAPGLGSSFVVTLPVGSGLKEGLA